jgi:hypothetical protein
LFAVMTGIAKMVFAAYIFRYAIFSTHVLTLSAWPFLLTTPKLRYLGISKPSLYSN